MAPELSCGFVEEGDAPAFVHGVHGDRQCLHQIGRGDTRNSEADIGFFNEVHLWRHSRRISAAAIMHLSDFGPAEAIARGRFARSRGDIPGQGTRLTQDIAEIVRVNRVLNASEKDQDNDYE